MEYGHIPLCIGKKENSLDQRYKKCLLKIFLLWQYKSHQCVYCAEKKQSQIIAWVITESFMKVKYVYQSQNILLCFTRNVMIHFLIAPLIWQKKGLVNFFFNHGGQFHYHFKVRLNYLHRAFQVLGSEQFTGIWYI